MKAPVDFGVLRSDVVRLAVGIPVYNGVGFVELSVQNCLDVGYDHIVYLDDGSVDGTYDLLKHYASRHNHITVIRNDVNSIAANTENRWKTVSEVCRGFDPDWIFVRAVDEALTFPAHQSAENALRVNLEALDSTGCNTVVFDYKNLWRSEWWYRTDGYCGKHHTVCGWKNDTGWSFDSATGLHKGAHCPNKLAVAEVCRNINSVLDGSVFVLHYGMSSHDRIARKLRYQLESDPNIWRKGMPHPTRCGLFNGLKIAHEVDLKLEKVDPNWFGEPIPDVHKPVVESLYDVICDYDTKAAASYLAIHRRLLW